LTKNFTRQRSIQNSYIDKQSHHQKPVERNCHRAWEVHRYATNSGFGESLQRYASLFTFLAPTKFFFSICFWVLQHLPVVFVVLLPLLLPPCQLLCPTRLSLLMCSGQTRTASPPSSASCSSSSSSSTSSSSYTTRPTAAGMPATWMFLSAIFWRQSGSSDSADDVCVRLHSPIGLTICSTDCWQLPNPLCAQYRDAA